MAFAPPQTDPIRAQIESPRRKLLDLTLRNRMLYLPFLEADRNNGHR
jgi:hypothetical protein